MLIPMEILSQMMTRTDSGQDMRQKTSNNSNTDNMFSKILDRSREVVDYNKTKKIGKTEEIPYETDVERISPQEPDKNAEDNENLVAGVVGYQNMVVFILEGDKESATTPEITVDSITAVGAVGMEEIVQHAEDEKDPVDTDQKQTAEDEKADEKETTPAQAPTEAEKSTETAVITAADVKTSANAEKIQTTETADVENEAESVVGEVTARKPIIRTSEQRENKDDSSEFSKNGDLGPLENENDNVPVKGQNEKTYSDTEDSARDAAGDAREPVSDAQIPLVDTTIRSERFSASEQMKRAADAPVQAENLFDEMVSRIETMTTESRQTVSIQLKPEFLGKVALEIAMDATGLHVKISAADTDVRSMINSQINALVESLSNKGIEVVEVEVAYTGVDNGAFKDSNHNQAQPDRPKRSARVESLEDGAAFYAAMPMGVLEYYLDAGVSSVEYSA